MVQYQTVVGLEVHIQMNTYSKAFCGDALSFGAEPNTHVSTISLAHPGTLPKPNKEHINKGLKLALSLNSEVNKVNAFDRKHYYYADSPKAYQITQDRLPICVGGALEIELADGSKKNVRIHHMHMEEDAGKTIHDIDTQYSMVDLNRAGTPLLELVTEPDLNSGDEVLAFIAQLQQLVRYLGISDGDMEKGSLRCDVNISVNPVGSKILGERCEVKNVNSKKNAKAAVLYESQRQIALLEKGLTFNKQTLHFDPESGRTSPMRDKEDADDYRYFPDPDLPPIRISQSEIDEIQELLPALPWEVKKKMKEQVKLNEYDSTILSSDKKIADYFFNLLEQKANPKLLANLMINKILPHLNGKEMSSIEIEEDVIISFLSLIENEKVSPSTAYQKLWPALIDNPSKPPKDLAQSLGILQIKDDGIISKIIEEVISENSVQAEEYRKGKKKVFGFLIGQAMRKSKGSAAPDVVKKALMDALHN